MKRRDFLTAEVIDDSEELIEDWILLVEALCDIEAGADWKASPHVTELLDEEI